MVRVLIGEQGTLDDLRRNLESMVEQGEEALDLFAAHAAVLADAGGTFPERQHVLAMANRFMIGHYLHLVEWARWALAEIEDWPDTTSPAVDRREQTLAMLEPGLRVLAERQASRTGEQPWNDGSFVKILNCSNSPARCEASKPPRKRNFGVPSEIDALAVSSFAGKFRLIVTLRTFFASIAG